MQFFSILSASAQEPPFKLPQTAELSRIKSAVITTSRGKIAFELYPQEAPWHVANFKYLADKGFYRGKPFHILIDDFIVQTGSNNDPDMHYVLPAEFSQLKHEFGVLGMARAADYLNPQRNSSGTQFHILLNQARNMDGGYTIFGKLLDGVDVLESLKKNDKIIDVSVYMEDTSYKTHPSFSRQQPINSINNTNPWIYTGDNNWTNPSYDTSLLDASDSEWRR